MEFIYERKVNYYETDKMGIVHHSNYIRYMEEARCEWLNNIDLSFATLEENGVTIPVLGVSCEYKHHVTYNDTVVIRVFIKEYTGVRMTIGYEITDKKNNNIVLLGETRHCFTTRELKPISLKKYNKDFYEKFKNML